MTAEEKRKHRRRLRRIQRRMEKRQQRAELRAARAAARAALRKPRKPLTTSKLALFYIFLCGTGVQVYSMIAMWYFGDLSAMTSLIGATVGEAIAYCAYAAKSTKENTAGGITYELAMSDRTTPPASDPPPAAEETPDDTPCG